MLNKKEEARRTKEKIEKHIDAVKESLEREEILFSPEARAEVLSMHLALCPDYPIDLVPFCQNGAVAYTDYSKVVVSVRNPVVDYYTSPYTARKCVHGLVFHEDAHILYSDLSKPTVDAFYSIKDKGELFNDKLGEKGKKLREALKKEEYREILSHIFHDLDNTTLDPHDEKKMCDDHGEYVAECIGVCRESLRSRIDPVEELDVEDHLENVLRLALQYARFGKLRSLRKKTLTTHEDALTIQKLAPYLDTAVTTDDGYERVNALNECMVILLDTILDAINKAEEEEKQKQSEQNKGQGSSQAGGKSESQSEQGNGEGSDGGKNKDGQGEESQGEESQDKDSQNGAGKDGGNQSANGNDRKQSQNQSGSGKDPKDQNQNGQSQKSSNENGEDENGEDGQGGSGSGMNNEPAIPSVNDIIKQKIKDALNKGKEEIGSKNDNVESVDREKAENSRESSAKDKEFENREEELKEDIARRKVEEELDSLEDKALLDEITDILSSTEMHKNVQVQVERLRDDGQGEDEWYEAMEELAPYSKGIQRAVKNALRDIVDGETDRGLRYGKMIEPEKAYRRDKRFFTNRHAPQDLPEIAISVLLDCSGSMVGERIEVAIDTARLMCDVANALNIPINVCGHDTGWNDVRYYVATDFDSTDADKFSIGRLAAGGCNRDGCALSISAERLARRPEEIKLLFLVSDGKPNHDGYGGEVAKKDLQSIVAKYKKQGIEFFAAAIGNDKEQIYEIYKDDFLQVDDLDTLPKTFAKILKKKLIRR